MPISIPILRHKNAKGWPEHPQGAAVTYVDYSTALKMNFAEREAYTAAYCVPHILRRLAKDAIHQVEGGIPIQLLLLDLDAPNHSKTSKWAGEVVGKIHRLFKAHPGGYCAESKNGFRVYYVLKTPHVVDDVRSKAAWTNYYKRCLRYLSAEFQLDFDGSCCDWTRLQRLPHDTREGVLQQLPTFGDPTGKVGWELPESAKNIEPTAEKKAAPREPKVGEPVKRAGGSVPVSKKFVREVVKRLPEFDPLREQFNLVLDGMQWATEGDRDNSAMKMTWALAKKSTELNPDTVQRLFEQSISNYQVDDPEFELDISSMYSRACAKITHERSLALADTAQAMGFNGITVYSADPEHVQHAQVNQALGGHPDLYSQAGEIVRVCDGQIHPVAQNMLPALISSVAQYVGSKGNSVAVPTHVARSCFSDTQREGWRQLLGVKESAALRPDGTMQCTEGYDEMTGVYLVEPVGDMPRPALAEAALTLAEPFQDFDFDSGGLAGCVACILTLLARDILHDLRSSVPAFVFTAPDAGSGKTTLAEICQIISGIRSPEPLAYVDQPAEMEKRFQAHVMGSGCCLYVDNWRTGGEVGGPTLDSMVTSKQSVQVRDFGQLRNKSRPWRTTILITGNQLKVRGDFTRRVVYISVKKRPKGYKFRIKNLQQHVQQNRVKYLHAACALLSHHILLGDYAEGTTGTDFASFEDWVYLVGGATMRAGFGDPCEGRKVLDESNDEDDLLQEAVHTLAECWPEGDLYYTAQELLELPDMIQAFTELEELIRERPPRRLDSEINSRGASAVLGKLHNSKAFPRVGVFIGIRDTAKHCRVWTLRRAEVKEEE